MLRHFPTPVEIPRLSRRANVAVQALGRSAERSPHAPRRTTGDENGARHGPADVLHFEYRVSQNVCSAVL